MCVQVRSCALRKILRSLKNQGFSFSCLTRLSSLKELQNEKKLTQEQIAEQLNVSGRTVSRWETGGNMPDIRMLVELAEFFDVSIPEIIDGERKSEKMNQEEKETLLRVADFLQPESYHKSEITVDQEELLIF